MPTTFLFQIVKKEPGFSAELMFPPFGKPICKKTLGCALWYAQAFLRSYVMREV